MPPVVPQALYQPPADELAPAGSPVATAVAPSVSIVSAPPVVVPIVPLDAGQAQVVSIVPSVPLDEPDAKHSKPKKKHPKH
jgi:hypothetical protein